MKLIVVVLLLINVLVMGGCKTKNIANEFISTNETQDTMNSDSGIVSEIPIDSVNGITTDEVLELCQNVVGKTDNETFTFLMSETHTGRKIGYRCDYAVEWKGKQYYIVCVLWPGEQENHWSAIGYLGVSSDGTEIYEVIVHTDENCSFVRNLWRK